MPAALAGKKIAETAIRAETGCNIVAIDADTAGTVINPPPETVLAADAEIVLIGTVETESRFLRTFAPD